MPSSHRNSDCATFCDQRFAILHDASSRIDRSRAQAPPTPRTERHPPPAGCAQSKRAGMTAAFTIAANEFMPGVMGIFTRDIQMVRRFRITRAWLPCQFPPCDRVSHAQFQAHD